MKGSSGPDPDPPDPKKFSLKDPDLKLCILDPDPPLFHSK